MTIQAEFQAVVLAAGRGSRMLEITSGQPKCLLPVGPKPLIWYTLNKLELSGFTEVILIILESQRAEIQSAIEREIEIDSLALKIDYVSVLDNEDDSGTADSLRRKEVQEKLKSDVLVVSCDLVSDVNLKGVLDTFRKHDASVATLLFSSQHSGETIAVPGPKSKYKPEKDLIGIDDQTSRLIFLASASDFESEVSLPMSLLRKHTQVKMHSMLVDSHVYVLKNWVIQYLKSENNFTSLKGELIPYIVKKQLSRPTKSAETNLSVATKDNNDIFAFAKEDELQLLIREASSYNDHSGDLKSAYHHDPIRCYAYIAPKGAIGVRVNTLPAYWTINGKLHDVWNKISAGRKLITQSPRASVQSTQVDDKCIIWEGARLSEKTSFKNSVIGTNSTVDSFSRVFNSVVMQNVEIKEKVALENCIVCDGAVVESGSKLMNCIVGNNHLVQEQSEHTNEVLTEALMHF